MIDADDTSAVSPRFAVFLIGPPRHRRLAAHLAGYLAIDPYVGALAALGADDVPEVRAAAARRLANLVAAGGGGPLAEAALRSLATDPGRSVPFAIASALAEGPSHTDTTRDVLAQLSGHPSATVRRWAAAAPGA